MSRALFSVTCTIKLINGQSGVANVEADTLTTLREVQAVLDRAMRMAKTLSEEGAQQEAAPSWRPSVVNNG
jgi:uncharacterized phage protein gp47/JayE